MGRSEFHLIKYVILKLIRRQLELQQINVATYYEEPKKIIKMRYLRMQKNDEKSRDHILHVAPYLYIYFLFAHIFPAAHRDDVRGKI